MNNKKERIADVIDRSRDELFELSKKIHDHPELGFEEFQAVEAISSVLERHGFQVQKGYGGLQTAFRADKAGKGRDRMLHFWRNMTHSEALVMAVVIISFV